MKKSGTALKGKAGPASKPSTKAGAKSVPKSASKSVLLYHFKNGVIRTCEVPSLRFETHAQTFPHHRCGFANNKLYLLTTGNDFASDSTLRVKGVIKVYDPHQHLVEQKIDTCACNTHEVPLLIRGQEVLDLGSCSRVLKLNNGQRELINTLNDLGQLEEYGTCLILNKLVYVVGGVRHQDRYEDDESAPPDFSIWTINWIGFKLAHVGVWPEIKLQDISVIPLSPTEFLVTGTLQGETGTAAYRLRGSSLTREGGSSRALGRCTSSCVLASSLYMLYDAGLVKCDLNTGYMRVYDLAKYERLKIFLWGFQHTLLRRLTPGIFGEICSFS